jgi:hypothetical protein
MMNRQAGRGLALIGAVLAIIALFIDYVPGQSYWNLDGTMAAVGLGAAIIAGLLALAAWAGQTDWDGWLFATGAFLIGYWGFFPALTAFGDWDQTRAGLWLAFAGGLLIAVGAAWSIWVAGGARSTPDGTTPAALAAGLGIALVFPGIFIDAGGDVTYWQVSGHSLGIVMLAVAILAGLVWAATVTGTATRGLDVALTLILFGLTAFNVVGAAFGGFGNLGTGAWLAFAGGILAAGGTWAARGAEMPRAAAVPA